MKPKIRQTFHVSDMLQSLEEMSVYLEDPNLSPEQQEYYIQKSVRIGLTLMAGYPSTMFMKYEMDFVDRVMKKLQRITKNNLDNNSDPDYYG